MKTVSFSIKCILPFSAQPLIVTFQMSTLVGTRYPGGTMVYNSKIWAICFMILVRHCVTLCHNCSQSFTSKLVHVLRLSSFAELMDRYHITSVTVLIVIITNVLICQPLFSRKTFKTHFCHSSFPPKYVFT